MMQSKQFKVSNRVFWGAVLLGCCAIIAPHLESKTTPPNAEFGVLRAQRVEIVDAAGRRRARLGIGIDKDAPKPDAFASLSLYSADGQEAATLAAAPDESSLYLLDTTREQPDRQSELQPEIVLKQSTSSGSSLRAWDGRSQKPTLNVSPAGTSPNRAGTPKTQN